MCPWYLLERPRIKVLLAKGGDGPREITVARAPGAASCTRQVRTARRVCAMGALLSVREDKGYEP